MKVGYARPRHKVCDTCVCTWRGRKSEQLNLRNPDSYRVLASPARSRGRIFLPSQLHLYVAHLMARSVPLGGTVLLRRGGLGAGGRYHTADAGALRDMKQNFREFHTFHATSWK